MSNKEFKPGDLIFLIDRVNYLHLVRFESYYASKTVEAIDIKTHNKYWGYGFAATPENREALVTLYGEDEVPKIPLRGSELTKKLIEQQNYVLCWTSELSDDDARENKELTVIEYAGVKAGWFICINGHGYNHAVPIDMCGNEIMEIE